MSKKKNKKKKQKDIDVGELHDKIWELIFRCPANEYEILGVLDKVSKEFDRLCEELWKEDTKSKEFEEEEEDDIGDFSTREINPPHFSSKKFDAMYR